MKLNLIYYKNVLDIAIEKFVQQNEQMFVKSNGMYVLGLNASKQKISNIVKRCISDSLAEIVAGYSQHDQFFVIGSCYPKDNLLLEYKDDKYFPRKLSTLIDNRPALKWLMAEKDIDIDIDFFNEICVDFFNESFNARCPKCSALHRNRITYVSHRKLDCYMMFKTIKWAYGSSNCCNVWKDRLSSNRQNLIAVNDLISKYIHNKSRMNKSREFKQCAIEVKDYLDKILSIA